MAEVFPRGFDCRKVNIGSVEITGLNRQQAINWTDVDQDDTQCHQAETS